MADQQETLQQYVSDMLALEKHIMDAVERQSEDDRVKNNATAGPLVNKIRQMIDTHTSRLEQHLEAMGGDAGSPVKEAASSVAGVAAGLYDKVRSDPVSKMLRDDYTALSLAAMAYTMLHTTGLALNRSDTADMALSHLNDLTPLIVDLSQVIPRVVGQELTDNGFQFDHSVINRAIQNSQNTWSAEHVRTKA